MRVSIRVITHNGPANRRLKLLVLTVFSNRFAMPLSFILSTDHSNCPGLCCVADRLRCVFPNHVQSSPKRLIRFLQPVQLQSSHLQQKHSASFIFTGVEHAHLCLWMCKKAPGVWVATPLLPAVNSEFNMSAGGRIFGCECSEVELWVQCENKHSSLKLFIVLSPPPPLLLLSASSTAGLSLQTKTQNQVLTFQKGPCL